MEEKKLTDDAEIDVGMIERSVELDDTAYVWLLKGSMWKTYKLKEILALIHRLQDENEQLKSTKHRASWKAKFFKAQAEIERLKEEKTKEVFGLLDQYEKAEADVHSMEREADGYRKTIAELQKQVDEIKEERENMQAVIFGLEEDKRLLQKQVDELKTENTELYKEHTTVIAGSILQKKQAVKDTAKEICDLILEHWEKKQFVECDWLRVAISEKYGVEVE